MATREVLGELALEYERTAGTPVALQTVGGVEAARRARSGEPLDIVALASEALGLLESEGHLIRGSIVPVADSGVAVAVRAGEARPDLSSGGAVRAAILAAKSIGLSTGPSGVHLIALLESWGIEEIVRDRIVQAPPGVAVGGLVASGEAAIGFQQLSELLPIPGIDIAGPLPAAIQRTTTFAAAICTASTKAAQSRAWLEFVASPATDAVKRRHGMEPPRS